MRANTERKNVFKKKTEVHVPKPKKEEDFEESPEKKFMAMAGDLNF